jgi:MFS family permease
VPLTDSNHLKRARLAVTITFILNGFGVGTFVSRIPDIKTTLHLSNSVLGYSLFFSSLGVLTALGPVGRNAAKRGSAPVIFYSTIVLSFAVSILGLLLNLHFLWLALFLFGFCTAAQDVAMNAHAVTLEQKSGRRMMSVFHGMWSIGTLVGSGIGGYLSQLGIKFIWHTLGVSLLILITAFLIKPLFLPANADQHIWSSGKKSRRPRLFWILGLLGLCGAIGEGAAGDWGGVLARDTFHASPFLATLPFILFSTTMVIGRFSGDYLAHRFGSMTILSFSGIIGGAGMAIGLFIGNIYGEIFGWLLLGTGVSVVIPLMFSAAGSMAINKFPGVISPAEAVAMVSGISYFGFVFGPPMMGYIADQITLRWAMLIPAGLAITLSIGSRITVKE